MTDITKKKILIIDDDSFLLNMYLTKLEKSGFEAIACASAPDALKKLREGLVPDVIVTDVIMPGMDGIEFLNTVRNEKLAPAAKLMVLSNQGEAVDFERANKINIDGYIIKATAIPSEVVKSIQDVVDKK